MEDTAFAITRVTEKYAAHLLYKLLDDGVSRGAVRLVNTFHPNSLLEREIVNDTKVYLGLTWVRHTPSVPIDLSET